MDNTWFYLAVMGTDVHGRIDLWNPRAEEVTGYSREEATGKLLIEDFLRAEFQTSAKLIFRAALEGEAAFDGILFVLTKCVLGKENLTTNTKKRAFSRFSDGY
jgi:PAS domain S-box-containing protein